MSFSPDGSTLASGSQDGTVHLWDVGTGAVKSTLIGQSTPIWRTYGVSSVSFNPDGTTLASVSDDAIVRLWDVGTGAVKSTIEGHTEAVYSVSFSPDGSTLASGSEDKIVRLWDVATGTLKSELIGHTYEVRSVSFSPDGSTLASGDGGGAVRLWDVSTSTLKFELTGLAWQIISVSFSPDGSTLASGGGSGMVHLWNVTTGTLKSELARHTTVNVHCVSFSPNGLILATGSADGTILLWDLAPEIPEPPRLAADVNGDGTVNIQDLVAVAAAFGETGETPADVNGDGVVNIQDLVAVAAAFGETAGNAPSAANLSAETVQQWLSDAKQLNLTDATSQRGIRFLEELLLTLTPKETALLPNYPNPFNPETWIPYHLAKDADVTLHIYAMNGELVRTLTLGHQAAGKYQNRSRAAYWDGKNAFSEPVASGLYFYTLTAGDFTATRKMLIRK